jgi:anthraniloyl-CoA monooxygenase
MRIVVVGGGPSGLYFALLMKKADPSHEVAVLERNAPDATFGWGVVFSEETLGALRDADRETYDQITETFVKWNAIDIRHLGGQGSGTVRSRGHAFSAISRKRLLRILQQRCAELGVDLRFHIEVAEVPSLETADLIVGADGVNSTVRRAYEDRFRPQMKVHSTKFAWFGTNLVFKAFTFVFRENEHGLFQVHAYPFDANTSTFIVECPDDVWQRAGLDRMTEEQSIAYCEKLFADDLAGHSLLSNRSTWISFVTLRTETWHHGNVVLLGDAAHTAHFTIGSGTKLAMEDAVALADSMQRYDDLPDALTRFELERQPIVERFQQAALESSEYFGNVRRYAAFDPIQFAFNLLTRSGRIGHLNLEMRDPGFVAMVDRWFASQAHGRGAAPTQRKAALPLVAPPPMFAPLRAGPVHVLNRVAVAQPAAEDAVDGELAAEAAERLAATAHGVGLVLTESVAASAEGRISPGTPGLYADAHEAAWLLALDESRSTGGAAIGLCLTHAGRRGATRPRRHGADRPLREGGWPVLAPSPLPYTRHSEVPKEATPADLDEITAEFGRAAARAARIGFDVLELDMGHGCLLASFLSPLTNRRTDAFGGSLENRIRFPLSVLGAVREAWSPDRALSVRLTASDWMPGGFDLEDAVAVARALKERGCDLIHVVAGQTVEHDRPTYGRFYLVPASDRIRNEAGVPTLVGGNLTTADDMNTILAAGRADLCLLEIRPAPA